MAMQHKPKLIRWIGRVFLVLLVVVVTVPLGFRLAASLREVQPLDAILPDSGRLIQTRLGRVFVQEAGPAQGTALLFIHGTAAWSELWRPTLDEMGARGYRAIAFDTPPFGFSDRAEDGDYSRQRSAERLLALVEALDVRPIVVAHSFGAGAGVEAVMQDPAAFAGLVIVDGALGLGSHQTPRALPVPLRPVAMRQIILSLTATNPLLTDRLLRSLIHVKDAATPDIVALLQRPMVRQDSTAAFADWLPSLLVPPETALSTRKDAYRALTVPTALIWGAKDTVTPPAQAEALAELIPDAALTWLPDVGHIPQIEAPDAFISALHRALEEHIAR